MICALCGNDNTHIQARMPDDRGIIREIYGCSRCAAMTPDYGIVHPLDTDSQIEFHQQYWKEIDGDTLQRELTDLAGVVASLGQHLGAPAAGNRVLEIGAGRGGLLRALRDAGYDAHGCEPAPGLVAIAREHYGLGPDVLTNVTVEQMLEHLPRPNNFSAVFLWHVLEHLASPISLLGGVAEIIRPGGIVIIQVPLLKSSYIYPEHYYFCSHETFAFIADEIDFGLVDVIYDDNNLFATAVFRKGSVSAPIKFFDCDVAPDTLSQIIMLNERSRSAYCSVLDDQKAGLIAWEKLANERLDAMASMEKLINTGLEAAAAQAAMIDQRDIDIAVLRQKVAELEAGKTEGDIPEK